MRASRQFAYFNTVHHAASPIYADGRIYFFSRDAVTTVIGPGRQFKLLAVKPAVAGPALFLRTRTHLVRIEQR